MPELPKFDDEDLKSYGDEEEESALCVFFSSCFFTTVFHIFKMCYKTWDLQQSSRLSGDVKRKKKWHGYDTRVINIENIQCNWLNLPLC